MSTKLYVGGLKYQTTTEGLRAAFAQAGEVSDAIVMSDRQTGQSRGFGFVTMATEEAAQAAIAMWNGKDLDGRMITVNEARPQEARTPGGDRGGDRPRRNFDQGSRY